MRISAFVLAVATAVAAPVTAQTVEASFDIIYFDTDSAVPPPLDGRVVRVMREWIAAHPDGRLMVEGHADDRGPAAYNLALSRARAEAVRDALVAAGIPQGSIALVASGETEPTSGDPARNRRVDIWATTF